MRKTAICFMLLYAALSINASAQNNEKYGNTLNLGLGIGGYAGYYGYVGRTLPVISANYEFDVAKSFTLAPFITVYSYRNEYYWGNKNYPYGYYYYSQTVVPIGVKGTYYFDRILNAGPKWDFYLAASLGFAIVSTTWDAGYYGDKNYYPGGSPVFFDVHAGAEYHINQKVGIFLDISSGVSTIGLAVKLK